MTTTILGLHAVMLGPRAQAVTGNGGGDAVDDRDASIELASLGMKFGFRAPSPRMRALLALLVADRHGEDELIELALAAPGADGGPRLQSFVRTLDGMGLVARTLSADGERLARLVPCARQPGLAPVQVDPATAYGLSRFAQLRGNGGMLVVESPLGKARIELLHPATALLVARLATCSVVDQLTTGLPPLIARSASALVALLVEAGVVGPGPAGAPHAGEDDALQMWEPHDLAFHARSRFGRHDGAIGRTYHFLGKAEPLPAVRPRRRGPFIDLPRPDVAALGATDRPFTAVVEARRSLRRFGEAPLTLTQIGEFLYRTARVRAVIPADGKDQLYETSDRPYPGGGGCYELEVYLVAHHCDRLVRGLYHYDPLGHQLAAVSDAGPATDAMLREAERASGSGLRPPLLIVLTARFGRMMWKYQTMAYAAILKDVGVLYQSMYLVATAMDLAPCALGGGDPEPLREVTGDAYWVESSVGEFMLGTLPGAAVG